MHVIERLFERPRQQFARLLVAVEALREYALREKTVGIRRAVACGLARAVERRARLLEAVAALEDVGQRDGRARFGGRLRPKPLDGRLRELGCAGREQEVRHLRDIRRREIRKRLPVLERCGGVLEASEIRAALRIGAAHPGIVRLEPNRFREHGMGRNEIEPLHLDQAHIIEGARPRRRERDRPLEGYERLVESPRVAQDPAEDSASAQPTPAASA